MIKKTFTPEGMENAIKEADKAAKKVLEEGIRKLKQQAANAEPVNSDIPEINAELDEVVRVRQRDPDDASSQKKQ
jgi:L-alanine-DL-glutamate epimerase-like enolase superfamily enzyme